MVDSEILAIDRPATLSQQAYLAIRQAIRSGALVQNELYSEGELARTMGISRTPVREALIELARERMIQIVPQRGFHLRELSPAEQEEVFALRRVLESFVVRRLVTQATADDIMRLRKVFKKQEQTMHDVTEFLTVDEQFHLLMPRLVGLERTYELLVTLRGAMWLIGSTALQLDMRMADVLAEHQQLIDAIEAGDGEAAEAAILNHLRKTASAVGALVGHRDRDHDGGAAA